jgi:hypothetical protein
MPEFKKGDLVKCIDDRNNPRLVRGRVYEVSEPGIGVIVLKNIPGYAQSRRFQLFLGQQDTQYAEADSSPPPAPPDPVTNPPHYTQHPSGVECVEIAEHMTFNVGNALKYLWRAGLKGDAVEDLRKAAWYVEREIARVQKMKGGAK